MGTDLLFTNFDNLKRVEPATFAASKASTTPGNPPGACRNDKPVRKKAT